MSAATAMQMPPGRREFDFTMDDHRIIAKIAYSTAGILLPDSKTQMVYGRLAPRVRERGLKSVAEYLKLIDQDAAERERAIDALTTNHTSFFRESHHFDHFTAVGLLEFSQHTPGQRQPTRSMSADPVRQAVLTRVHHGSKCM